MTTYLVLLRGIRVGGRNTPGGRRSQAQGRWREAGHDGDYPDVMLDLCTSRTFDSWVQLLEDAPRVLDGPPGAR